MNEKRKKVRDYLNNKFTTPEQEHAEDLLSAFYILIRTFVLLPKDKSKVERIIKQLEDTKQKPTKQTLRSMERVKARILQEYNSKLK